MLTFVEKVEMRKPTTQNNNVTAKMIAEGGSWRRG